MPAFGPVSRSVLIRLLHKAGFQGPYSGGKHAFMIKGDITLTIPNSHNKDIGKDLLIRVLRQAGITREQWEML